MLRRLTTCVFFALLALTNCQTSSTVTDDNGTAQDSSLTDGETIGTTIFKPKLPTLNLFPDFESEMPEATLGANLAVSETASVPASSTDGVINVAELWNSNFLDGGLYSARQLRRNVKDFGSAAAEALAEAGITEITDSLQTATTTATLHFVDTESQWQIEVITDSGDANYIRYYFRNAGTGKLQGTYVLKTGDDGEPQKGLFAYVNEDPQALATRVAILVFDFTDPTKKLLATRTDKYHGTLLHDFVLNVFQQCDETTSECVGESIEIVSAPPERVINPDTNTRFGWNESSGAVCLALMNYDSGQVQTRATYAFTGPETPDTDDITQDSCEVTTPHWGEHVFTASDLLLRYGDTDPLGGDGLAYFVDGIVTSGWDTLTVNLIADWLAGTNL